MGIVKKLFSRIFVKNNIKLREHDSVHFVKSDRPENLIMLWYQGSEADWENALSGYYYMLRNEQREIEEYIEYIDAEEVRDYSSQDFYNFLYHKYFVWKYTAKNRLATTRKCLERYVLNDELPILQDIQTRLFKAPKNRNRKMLEDCM